MFSTDIWQESAPMRQAIHTHPFNDELAQGILRRSAFQHYMIQDSLYLQGFARALAIGAAKAPGASEIMEFAEAARVAIVVERALHADYLRRFDIDPALAEQAPMSPACQAYVDYLLARAFADPFPVLAAAILPCFWIYHDVGLSIARRSTPDNFFQQWIDTYTDADFAAAVTRMIGHVDRAALHASPAELDAMRRAFLRCTQYEWIFWDGAYHEREWPL